MNTKIKLSEWIGLVITGLISLLMISSAAMKVAFPPNFSEQWDKFGYPADLAVGIAVVELLCVVLYLIPQTSILGCVLLTGYLGGAIATHVRVRDNFIPVVVIGMLVWLALYLRDERLRALLPLRKPRTTEATSPG